MDPIACYVRWLEAKTPSVRSHGPMHRRRDARRYDRAAHVGAMLGFMIMWGMLAAACWAAGGAL